MSEWDRTPRYKPSAPPDLSRVHATRVAPLQRPYVACWINSQGVPVALGAFHLYKAAVTCCRKSMNDNSTPTENHHSRFYVYDSSRKAWNPDDLHCWTPVAERLRDQWVPRRV